MQRFLLFILMALTTSLFYQTPANAQTGVPQNLGDGDLGWCTVQNGSANPTICGLASANAACALQMASFAPTAKLGQTVLASDRSAFCNWDRTGTNELLRPGTVPKRCNTGYSMINGVCQELEYLNRCSDCSNGVTPKVGNPISILSGAKTERFTDFETADGRMRFGRVFNSRPYGIVKLFGIP